MGEDARSRGRRRFDCDIHVDGDLARQRSLLGGADPRRGKKAQKEERRDKERNAHVSSPFARRDAFHSPDLAELLLPFLSSALRSPQHPSRSR